MCLVARPDLDSLKRHGLPVILSVEYFEWLAVEIVIPVDLEPIVVPIYPLVLEGGPESQIRDYRIRNRDDW